MINPSATHLPVRVWSARLSQLRPAHLGLLDAAERDRRGRYRRPDDRDRFALGAVLLRLAAAGAMDVPAGRVPVDRTCPRCGAAHGRPVVADGPHVSVSHSGERVLLALTPAAPVGVDVERVGERAVAGLERLVLGPGERAAGPEQFYRYWCRKEAVVKATGDGLRVPLSQVLVSPPDRPAALLSYRGSPLSAAMADLPAGEAYPAALAVLAAGTLTVDLRDAAGLLAG